MKGGEIKRSAKSQVNTHRGIHTQPTHPCTAKTAPIEGEEGGVAVSLRLAGEPSVGGDVEGTAKFTDTPSSVSPKKA